MKHYASILLAGVASLLMATAQATPISISFSLSGAQETPNPVVTPGTGFATVTVDTALDLLTVDVTWSGLTSGTTASHIHCCSAFGTTAMVATTTPTFANFPLGVTSGTFHTMLNMTLASSYNPAFITANGNTIASAEAALFSGILNGRAYLNIHTSQNPGGEIRGQIVPEPATLALVFAGFAAAGLARRRRASS
jgi:CHRD domain/PEP-CTERM motif